MDRDITTYTVALQGARDVPVRDKIAAEMRFASELELVLGGGEYVAETYRAWIEVSECAANQTDRNTAITAARWPVALNATMQAGFSKLGHIGEAHFEVRLERHAA